MRKINKFLNYSIFVSATVLALTPMAFTGCQQPTGGEEQTPTVIPTPTPTPTPDPDPTPDPKPEEYTFYTENLGCENSGINIYKWYQDGVDKLGLDGAAYRNKAVTKYGAYINQQVNALNKSLNNSDDATKNYLKTYINGLKQNTYTGDNLNQSFDTVYNGASYIFTDLIEASESKQDGIDLCYSFELAANKAYVKSGLDGDKILNTYNDKIDHAARKLTYGTSNMSRSDVETDIAHNNCGEIVTLLKNQLIKAALRLNAQKGLNLTFDQVVQIVNLTISARSIHCMHDYYKLSSENYLDLENNMENAIKTLTNQTDLTNGL